MSRLDVVTDAKADGKTRDLFAGIDKKLGSVPNIMRTMANSRPVLEGYLGFSSALAKGALPAKLAEQIALVVGQANGCDYCLAAHAALGRMAGLADEDVANSRRGKSQDTRTQAALTFARKVVSDRGRVEEDDVASLRGAGFNDGEIAEIVAHVALNIFTNYFNHVAGTPLDFPAVEALDAAPACAC